MIRNPKPENLAKLTPEQRKVFDQWQIEAERADLLMQGLLDALASNDQITISTITRELDDLIPATCEHGHSVYLSCMECAEIEKTLFPEDYDANGNRINIDDLLPLPKSEKTWN